MGGEFWNPPPGGLAVFRRSVLTNKTPDAFYQKVRVGPQLVGDLNHPGGDKQYRIWTGSGGIRELADPRRGTFAGGDTLDKVLYPAGDVIPLDFLPDTLQGEYQGDEGWHKGRRNPATTLGTEMAGNRHPVELQLSYGVEVAPPKRRTLKIKHLTSGQ